MLSTETLVVTRYGINRCGYYFPHQQEANAHAFGNTAGIVHHLDSWVKGKNLLETQTFAKTDEMLPTYLLDISDSINGEYIICMWNNSYSANGQVLSVNASDLVGTNNVKATPVPRGGIPGYPSYFWIRPSTNEYLTVQFAGGLNGRNNFAKYMESFMEKFDPVHVNAKNQVGLNAEWHKEVNGYQEGKNKKLFNLNAVEPQFRSFMARGPGRIQEIESQLDNVYKVIKKADLVTAQPSGAGLLKSFLKELGVGDTNVNSNIEYRVHQAFNYKPSLEQFQEIVAKWEADQQGYDVGFNITGYTSPLWLSNSIHRSKLGDVPIKKTGDFSIDCKALLKELQKRDAQIT